MLFQIRAAGENDASAVYHFICLLEETLFDKAAFERIFKSNIYNKDIYYLVAETEGGRVAAFISCHTQNLLHHCGKVAEIQELFVAEEYRSLGVGRLLVNALEEKLRAASCCSFEVTAQNKRLQTHAFYEKAGFESTHKKFVKQII